MAHQGFVAVTVEDARYPIKFHRCSWPGQLAAMSQIRGKWLISGTKQNWSWQREMLPGTDKHELRLACASCRPGPRLSP